jgi:hypothetical protein
MVVLGTGAVTVLRRAITFRRDLNGVVQFASEQKGNTLRGLEDVFLQNLKLTVLHLTLTVLYLTLAVLYGPSLLDSEIAVERLHTILLSCRHLLN